MRKSGDLLKRTLPPDLDDGLAVTLFRRKTAAAIGFDRRSFVFPFMLGFASAFPPKLAGSCSSKEIALSLVYTPGAGAAYRHQGSVNKVWRAVPPSAQTD